MPPNHSLKSTLVLLEYTSYFPAAGIVTTSKRLSIQGQNIVKFTAKHINLNEIGKRLPGSYRHFPTSNVDAN